MSAVLGVDPGVRGGLAVLDKDGMVLHVQPFRPEMTHKELVECVTKGVSVLVHNRGFECYIEKVGFKRGDGGLGAFTFGQVSGILRGAVLALGPTLRDVAPMIWQSNLDCLSGGNKNVTKNKALQLFAGRGFTITHAIADALLIAEFGRRRLV